MATVLSPIPEKSPILDAKKERLFIDWLRWFSDLAYYVKRLLNKYDSSNSGLVTLAGTIVVANPRVTATSRIRVSRQVVGGTIGHLSIVLNPGVGFTINSSEVLDTSTVFYEIVEAF